MKISPIGKKKLIYKPRVSESLAEFCGIMLGDGGISQSFIHITLHRTDDLEYIDFVLNLIKKLFRTDPFIYDQKKYSIKRIVLNRKELVAFLTETLGLPLGNKLAHPSPLPEWINRSDKFSRACLRGLIDTDGSVFTHRYKSKGKVYRYYKINFSNKSPALIKFVWHKLRKQGIKSRINKTGTEVCIDAQSDVILYYKTIGFHNPKHLKKLKNYIIVS